MRIQFQDQIYSFENKLTLAEAMLLFDKSKVGLNEFFPELIKGNPYVAATLVFILARRNKHVIDWNTLMGENAFDIKLLGDEDGAPEADSEAERPADKPDPTVRSSSGKTRRRATSST